MRGLVFVVALLAAPFSLAAAQAQNVLTADSPQTTGWGATLTAPAAWTVQTSAKLITLSPPEPKTHVAIVEVGAAKDGANAVAKAWQIYQPGFARPVQLVTPRPARNGWDERQLVDYETSPNEQVAIQAVALRAGASWTVAILDATQSIAEKRNAAIGLVLQSLRPAGYARESFAGRPAHPLDAGRIEQIRAFVETSLSELGIPGAGLALYDHGKVVFEGGVGVKEVGKPDPVDAHTLFMVASNTKGMSTLLLAQLVDAGRLRWDQPVTEVYPAFRLGSDATTKQVLVRHLVCACTGLPRKDFDWIFNTPPNTKASTTFTQLATTQPTSGFGEVFQYNNLMASAAGYIAGSLYYPKMELGQAYDQAMQEKIFNPLGMKETTFDMAKAEAGNHASPHGGGLLDTPQVASMDLNYAVLPFRPAGGAWSSAHDMMLYVEDELRLGVLANGARLVSADNLLARRKPGVPTGEDEFYGMGLENNTVWGVPVVHHGGSMGGYKSDIMFLPDAGVGAVILTNSDSGQSLLRPFMRRLLEVVYDGKLEAAADVTGAAARNKAGLAEFRRRLSVPPAPEPVKKLAKRYANSELGGIEVQSVGPDVVFKFTSFSSKVASRLNDDGTISFFTIDPTNEGFEFVVGERGGKRVLITRDGQHEYVFAEMQ